MPDIQIKERILKHAAEKYLTFGITKVPIDEIAAELGISKKTVYEFFHGKKALLKEVVDLIIKRMEAELGKINLSDTKFENKITDTLAVVGNIFGSISKQFISDLKRFEPELWSLVEIRCRERVVANLDELFKSAKSKKLFREDIDTEIFYISYVNSVRDIINADVLSRNSFSAAEALNGILRLLIDGALTSEARENHFTIDAHYTVNRNV